MEIKKIIILISLIFVFLLPIKNVQSQESKTIDILFFWQYGCPHCEEAKPFLENLKNNYQEVDLKSFEVSENEENRDFFIEVNEKLGVDNSRIPFIVVEDEYFIGWHNEKTTGKQIENEIENILGINNEKEYFNIPFLGEVNIKTISLPVITIIFGALDGFNPCAMWVLLFLISFLLGMENRKKMWILGTAFIVSSALVYFIFMSAWLNLLLFLGFIFVIRIIIGLVALGGGVYNIKEYFSKDQNVCKVVNTQKRKRVFERIKETIEKKSFLLSLIGIIILAFAVNLVELICSAGFPAIYTQILTLSNLSNLQYYLYILLYILIFMLDDLLVFIIAMMTLKITGITTKYTKYSHLIGGILLIIIGILIILKPDLLMFG
jgi:glutaredoxin